MTDIARPLKFGGTTVSDDCFANGAEEAFTQQGLRMMVSLRYDIPHATDLIAAASGAGRTWGPLRADRPLQESIGRPSEAAHDHT